MTEEKAGSSIPRRTLGIALRTARERNRVTMATAAEALDCSVATVRRIERGTVSSKMLAVAKLCDLYHIADDMREVLISLAKETRAKGQWWHAYGDVVPAWFELYVTLETTARRIRLFDPLLVPGPLQVREYMQVAIRADRPGIDDAEIDARIKLKQSRQAMLTRSFPQAPELSVILAAEPVFGAGLAPAVVRAQLWHLLQATEQSTVTLRVLPHDTGPHRASVCGAFTLLDFPQENANTPPSMVYSEMLTGAIYLDQPSEVDAYEAVWAALGAQALNQADTIDLLAKKLKELNDSEH